MLIIVLLISVMGGAILYFLTLMDEPLQNQIPKTIDPIAESSRIDGILQQLRFQVQHEHDSLRLYVLTKDVSWLQKFYFYHFKVERLFEEVKSLTEIEEHVIFQQIVEIEEENEYLEQEIIRLMEDNDSEEARKLMFGGEFFTYEKETNDILKQLYQKRGYNVDEVIETSTVEIKLALKEVNSLALTIKKLVYSLLLFVVILVVIIGYRISKSVSIRIKMLTEATKAASMGRSDTQMFKRLRELRKSKDEIGDLSRAVEILVSETGKGKNKKSRKTRRHNKTIKKK